jgi:hypothetical protein
MTREFDLNIERALWPHRSPVPADRDPRAGNLRVCCDACPPATDGPMAQAVQTVSAVA